MDCAKVGNLISSLRKEKKMTQKQVAQAMNISDKTISKWERGLGCPDVSLLNDLSKIFNVNIEKILSGDLEHNSVNGGNMKRIKFYVCPNCGSVLNGVGDMEISCCGRKLSPLVAKPVDEDHQINIEVVEDDYYVTFSHPMSKSHYLSFIAYATHDRVLMVKLYPEQSGEVRLPQMRGGSFYYYCSEHGLWVKKG